MSRASAPPVLVVGTGFGCRIHVPALRAAGFDVVGLVGTDADRSERRAARSQVPRSFTDLDEAITRTGAVAVSVATPPDSHAALTQHALQRGCHVLCEKPFAMDAAEARGMLEAAERSGLVHMVGHEFRWAPERAVAARAIAEGRIGEPRFLTLALYVPMVADPESRMPRWWFDADAGGGWLGASGSHVIDQVRSWLGEFDSLSASLPIVSDRRGVAEDSYAVRFRLANGVEGILQQTCGAWGPIADVARVAGSHGSLWLEGDAVFLADSSGQRQLPVPPDLELPPPPPTSSEPGQQYSHLELGPYTRLCQAFRAAIDGKGPAGPVEPASFADGVRCMEVLDAIRASAAEGGALTRLPA